MTYEHTDDDFSQFAIAVAGGRVEDIKTMLTDKGCPHYSVRGAQQILRNAMGSDIVKNVGPGVRHRADFSVRAEAVKLFACAIADRWDNGVEAQRILQGAWYSARYYRRTELVEFLAQEMAQRAGQSLPRPQPGA